MARGLLAELNRMAKQAAREAERAQRAAERERVAAVRRSEQARRAEERAASQLATARGQDRKRLEKQAQEAHVATQMALVEQKNAELDELYDEIDTLLHTTLGIDDFVDLNSLKATAKHPAFDREDLLNPGPEPVQPPQPPKPVLELPPRPTGLGGLFGKKKHERSVAAAMAAHDKAMEAWEATKIGHKTAYEHAVTDYQRKEAQRLQDLEAAQERYSAECRIREQEASEQHSQVDKLIADLGYGVPEAIEEYVSIVLGNSVYPEHFQVNHSFSFDSETAELTLRVVIPPPDSIPTIKVYKYTKSKDEISWTNLSQDACRDRYASAVHQVALRTLHEIFEGDRRGLIQTISLEVGTETTDPATGNHGYIPFVATGADRSTFVEFDLSAVVPAATLGHLGASVSKNPYALESTETSGVRKS